MSFPKTRSGVVSFAGPPQKSRSGTVPFVWPPEKPQSEMVSFVHERIPGPEIGTGPGGLRLLFLQVHRETDRFLKLQDLSLRNMTVTSSTTTVWYSPHNSSSHLKSNNICFTSYDYFRRDDYSLTNTHSPITLANFSSINLIFIFRCSSWPWNWVYPWRVDSSTLVFGLSSHRHSYISLIFRSHFIDS